jgi:hypothetical protein
MTAAGSLDVVSTSFPTAFQWNNYLHEELHATSSAHELGTFHAVGANYLVAYFTNMVGGAADNAPDAGVAHGYLTTDQQMLDSGVEVDKALVHEIGHLTGRDVATMHRRHTNGYDPSRCAFGEIALLSFRLYSPPICSCHCADVRKSVVRLWADHQQNEIRRNRAWDSQD